MQALRSSALSTSAARTLPSAKRPLWILEPGPDQLSGGWLFALRLARSTNRDVTIVCPAGSQAHRAAISAGIPVADCQFPRPLPSQALALLRCSGRLRRQIPSDVVVVSGAARASLVALLARLPNPVVHLMHERDSANRLSVRLALRHSQAVVTVGANGALAYKHALPHARVIMVNNFLGAGELAALAQVRGNRASSQTRPRPVLGVLARLVPEKGVDLLINELAVHREVWDRLLIAGDRQDAQYAQNVEDRIARRGLSDKVSLLGARADVAEVLGRVDVVIVPSTGNEGQPTVIIEALAAGLPVIVREGVIGDEFSGLPVRTYSDSESLATALSHLPRTCTDSDAIASRFGVEQLLAGLDAASSPAAC